MSQIQVSHTVTAKRRLSFSTPHPVKLRRQYDPVNLQRAYDATNKGMSAYRASRLYGVPESTIKDRRSGRVETGANPGPLKLFSSEEEQRLADHIKHMASIGYGYTKANVQYLAADFAVACGKKMNSDKPLSDSWFYGFLTRWENLKVAKPQKLSLLRAKCASKDVLDQYFKELCTIISDNGLERNPERIYNIDETGINTEHAPPHIVCDATSQPQAVTSPRSSTVTIIGGGNAVGNQIPPYYIFPGKRWNSEFLNGAPTGADGEMSDSGWSNSLIFQNYLTKHFIKYANVSSDTPTLVLFDGHKSHVQLSLVDWAREKNIILFVLPPHTSHITQPLDVGVFGPLKSMYYRECQLYLQKHPGQKITKYEVSKLTSKPYLKALCPENLISSFRKTGIYPFSDCTIKESQIAPSSIYPSVPDVSAVDPQPQCLQCSPRQTNVPINTQETDKENIPEGVLSPRSIFFKSKTITGISDPSRKPRKKFVPPFLAGSLSKPNNITVLQAKKPKANQATITDNSSQSVRSVSKSSTTKAVPPSSSKQLPHPGPSAYCVISSEAETESGSEDESSNCCVCHKFSPPALKQCTSLVIVKWAQCDKCHHWTHLSFCTEVRVVRRHSEFLCPHCQ
ncbi:uncharacterized protein LOC132730954 [Ruditapes philippinarum]|uniref:uncharacterized protein LOC132730954 n=1 Tax=Ruditapes philippinarum TaxID=129788 RepID=UPI00295BCC3E|nr:uncharacterized protein LOC132730954 [Ruditapes philippinarum]